jgi:uncharacterized cofD-like protein
MDRKKIKVTLICGGHGPFHIIKALLKLIGGDFPGVTITCICPNSDGGGSTGQLAEEGGHRSIGDVSCCIAALTPNAELEDRLFERYEKGIFVGHSLKNLILHFLAAGFGIYRAITVLSGLCKIKPHQVLPVTPRSLKLCVRMANGKVLTGEQKIDTLSSSEFFDEVAHKIASAWLSPVANAQACPRVLQALKSSDFIIICPGSFWTSIIAVLLAGGVKEAIMESNAKLIMLVNLITQMGDTHGLTVAGFIKKIEPYLGRPLDYVVANNGPLPDSNWVKKVMEEAKLDTPISLNGKLTRLGRIGKDKRVIQAKLLAANAERGFHHDPTLTAEVLAKIIAGKL